MRGSRCRAVLESMLASPSVQHAVGGRAFLVVVFSHAIHTTNTSKGAARVGHGRLSTLRWRHVRAYADYQHFGGPPQIINYRQIVSACQAGGKKTTDLQLGVKEIIGRLSQRGQRLEPNSW